MPISNREWQLGGQMQKAYPASTLRIVSRSMHQRWLTQEKMVLVLPNRSDDGTGSDGGRGGRAPVTVDDVRSPESRSRAALFRSLLHTVGEKSGTESFRASSMASSSRSVSASSPPGSSRLHPSR